MLKLKTLITKLATAQPDFKKIYRPYRKLKGYPDFKDTAAVLAMTIDAAETLGLSGFNTIQKELIFTAKYIAQYSCSVYWIAKDFVCAMINTDPPRDLSWLKKISPMIVFMLPPGIKNPDGETVEFVCVQYMEANQVAISFKLKNQILDSINYDKNRLRWSTILNGTINYSSTSEIPENETGKLIHGHWQHSTNYYGGYVKTEVSAEQQFISTVENLVLNTLFYLQSYPESVAEPTLEDYEVKVTKGFGAPKTKTKENECVLSPIMVGKEYQVKARSANKSDLGDARKYNIHTSTWWRRGHYRHVAVGKREDGERKLIWVEPVFISR